MVVKSGAPVRSVNAGEFDPGALSRIDTKQYYSGAKRMKGFEPVPQSGFRLMGGTRRICAARKGLTNLPLTVTSFAPGPHAGEAVIWEATFSGALAVFHAVGLSVSAGTAAVYAEVLIGGVWTRINALPFSIGQTVTERTAAFAPGTGRAATAVRLKATPSVAATFTVAGAAALAEGGGIVVGRHGQLSPDDGKRLSVLVSAGIADFADDSGWLGAARISALTEAMLPDIDLYGEADTVGIAHPSSMPTQRIRRLNGSAHEWVVDNWPYDPAPEVILDGTYAKTDDVWEIMMNWEGAVQIFLVVTVDGEQTTGIALEDISGNPMAANASVAADWTRMAIEVEAAVQALPSLGAGVTVAAVDVGGTGTHKFVITFAGDYSGDQYQVSAEVVNTVKASANPVHVQVGETTGEPLFSPTRGYPGLFELVQDRLVYGRIPAKTGAVALSKVAEYFNLNIKGQNDAAARIDNLRSVTTETVLAVKESKYFLIGTDRGVYFAVNRTIERNTPLNFVRASETGIRANTRIVDLDGVLYYVSNNGEQLLSLIYDDVSTTYNADAQSLLASHLVSGINRDARQKAQADQDAGRLWLMREDGRLICGQIIRNQDITGFCEWRVAHGGLVREIGIDGNNRLWLLILRDGALAWELYENDYLLQGTVSARCDLNGQIGNLAHVSGEVWAVAGHGTDMETVLGPFTVEAGRIALGDFHDGDIHVGCWIAPDFEGMPLPLVLRNEEIVFRPGRIHTAHVNVLDTTSIAIGANGGAVQDMPLRDALDAVNMPVPKKTKMVTRPGMLGSQVGPTLQITQLRPGRLRVRDLATEAKL